MDDDASAPLDLEPHDLRAYPRALVDQDLLTGPAFAGLSDAAFRAQMHLALAAWRQVPAGTVPMAHVSLAQLAGLGRDVAAWGAVAEECLAHWRETVDGRWALPALLPAVIEAAERQGNGRAAARERKRMERVRALMRKIGVRAANAEIDRHAARILEHIEARGGDALRGARRAEEAAWIARELGLLPRGGGALLPGRQGGQFVQVAVAAGKDLSGVTDATGHGQMRDTA